MEHGDPGYLAAELFRLKHIGLGRDSRLDVIPHELANHALGPVLFHDRQLRRRLPLCWPWPKKTNPPLPEFLAPLLPRFERSDSSTPAINQEIAQFRRVGRKIFRRLLNF